MTAIVVFPDTEDLVLAWVKTTSVAPLVNNKAFLGMPKGSPLPVITLSRVGGGLTTSDVPTDEARISIHCWADKRPQAKVIAQAVVSEADSLALTGGYTSVPLGGILRVAEVVMNMWLPDPVSNTPRYVIDVRFTVTPL